MTLAPTRWPVVRSRAMTTRAALFATLLTLAGCPPMDVDHDGTVRIVCVGDSNTDPVWAGMNVPYQARWCEYAAVQCRTIHETGGASVPASFTNVSYWGATAHDRRPTTGWRDGWWQSAAAVANHADAVVVMLGTNDLAGGLSDPAGLVADLQTICDTVAPAACYVATVPAAGVEPNAHNAAIRAHFAGNALDATSDVVPVALGNYHIDDASEQVIAARVTAALGCVP